MAKRSIDGSRAIVTGASSGIGREIASELARKGAHLIITARRQERLEQLAGEFRSGDRHVIPVPGDITDPQLRSELITTARDHLGGLDLLVNNAGVGGVGEFSAGNEDCLRHIMEVNFFAPVELTRIALPLLRKGRAPMIVNVSSVLGHRAVPKKSEYSAAKFAVHGFSDAIRAELAAKSIDVLIISPSTTDTEFFDVIGATPTDLPWLKLGSMSPKRVAKKAVKAIQKGKHEIILSPGGKLLVWFDRLAPPAVNRLVARFG